MAEIEKNDDTNLYELSFLIIPEIAEEHLPAELEKIVSVVERHGGAVTLRDNPKLRGLAYTIERSSGGKRQKFNQAHFGWLKFNAVSTSIPEIAKELTTNHNIIRHLLIHGTNVIPSSFARRNKDKADAPAEAPTEAEIDKEVEKLIESTQVKA